MSMARALDCDCGKHLEASDDDALAREARRHIDDAHPEMDLSDEQVRGLVADKARDA